MKTEFNLECLDGSKTHGVVKIIGERPRCKPYATIIINKKNMLFVKDSDIERLAVNILKSLKSKKLK